MENVIQICTALYIILSKKYGFQLNCVAGLLLVIYLVRCPYDNTWHPSLYVSFWQQCLLNRQLRDITKPAYLHSGYWMMIIIIKLVARNSSGVPAQRYNKTYLSQQKCVHLEDGCLLWQVLRCNAFSICAFSLMEQDW